MFGYFNTETASQFSYLRVPKFLLTEPGIREISADSKLLYSLMLNVVELSQKNGWVDKLGRIYIYYTNLKICEELCCADKKATRLLQELEECDLIERKRQGQGKPTRIYVKNFYAAYEKDSSKVKERAVSAPCENNDSSPVKTTILNQADQRGNKTKTIKTEYIQSNPIGADETEAAEPSIGVYREVMWERLDMDGLLSENPMRREELNELFDIVIDTLTSHKKKIRICGDMRPLDIVKGQLMKLTRNHVMAVLEGITKNTTQIKDIKQYVLAALYNSTMTLNNQICAQVSHDMAEFREADSGLLAPDGMGGTRAG